MEITNIIINTVVLLSLIGGLVALAREIERAYTNYTWKRRFEKLKKELDAEIEPFIKQNQAKNPVKKAVKKAVKKSK